MSDPVFVLGAPRSGTSLVYKALCLHPDAVWISNWVRRAPALPELAVLARVGKRMPARRRATWFGRDGTNAYVYGRRRRVVDRLFPMPVEGEPVFARCGLAARPGQPPDPERDERLRRTFRRLAAAAGGTTVVSKRIAHNVRIPALEAAFPTARYVTVTRDGRAVAASLAKVDWWPDAELWWLGGTPRGWEGRGRDPWALCAEHWVREIDAIDDGLAAVAPSRVLSIRYEDLVRDPVGVLADVATFARLRPSGGWERELGRLRFPDKNDRWRDQLDPSAIATIETIERRRLEALGYWS